MCILKEFETLYVGAMIIFGVRFWKKKFNEADPIIFFFNPEDIFYL